MYQPIYKTITTFSGLPYPISGWESKGLSNEKFTPPFTSNKSISPKSAWYNSRIKLKFKGSHLKQEDQAAFTPKNVVNIFIVYELDSWPQDSNTEGCLFGGVMLTKNADPDKYSYSGFGIGFDSRGQYSLPNGSVGKNFIIFGVGMSPYVHIDNKGRDI